MGVAGAPVIGVALATMRYQPAADEFWMKALFDDGLRRGDPAKTLINWFLSKEERNTRPIVRARACSAAWGTHYEGRSLAKIHATSEKSSTIAGTPVRIGGSTRS